jgi:hypothetical protein
VVNASHTCISARRSASSGSTSCSARSASSRGVPSAEIASTRPVTRWITSSIAKASSAGWLSK